MSFSHISHASMKTLVAGIAAAATLCTGAIATMQTANAADASTAPSIAGHAYNDLPVGNPDVTVTQIDNSALPATLRNPIGQNEGTNTPNDLSQNYYSADASTLEYDGKLFVFTGHDEAEPTYGSFNMKDWGVYVTDNPESGKWTHYKTIAKADLFDWGNRRRSLRRTSSSRRCWHRRHGRRLVLLLRSSQRQERSRGSRPVLHRRGQIKKPPRTMGRRHRSAVADYHADANRNHRSRILRGQ